MLTKTVFSYNVNNIKTDFCYLRLKITEKGGIMEDKQMNPLGETVTESVAPVAATTAADGTGYAQMPKSKGAGDVVGRFWKLRIASAVAPVAFLTLALVGVLIMFVGNTSVDYAYILAGIFGAIAASLVSVALAVQSKNKPVNAALMVAMTAMPCFPTLVATVATFISIGTINGMNDMAHVIFIGGGHYTKYVRTAEMGRSCFRGNLHIKKLYIQRQSAITLSRNIIHFTNLK